MDVVAKKKIGMEWKCWFGGKEVFLWMAGGVGVKDRAFDEVDFWAN